MATKVIIRLAFVLAGLLAAAVGTDAAQANPKIAARDQLVVTVVGVKEFSNRYPVSADGVIEFPELGRVSVIGLTAREAGDLLARRLRETDILRNPQVAIELEQTANKRVTVNGSVRTQGPVAYAGELTLLDAIVRAGGRLPEAADEVLVVRAAALQGDGAGSDTHPDPVMLAVNVRDLENGILANNVLLHDGDAVFVRRAQAVTITGYVVNVGAYNVESGSTVEQALALAGGVSENGSDRRIEITRKVDGKAVTLKGVKKTDLVKAGDIIKVGKKLM